MVQQKQTLADPIPKELYDILACPVCKGDLKYTPQKNGLRCDACKYTYPIKDGIPVLLPPEMQK
ncbi:Trm112 family protein [Candidatus Woesearchaeota archaeon]|nr:Trm112 family protein [Candidatus Woesearchaeota archaeon]